MNTMVGPYSRYGSAALPQAHRVRTTCPEPNLATSASTLRAQCTQRGMPPREPRWKLVTAPASVQERRWRCAPHCGTPRATVAMLNGGSHAHYRHLPRVLLLGLCCRHARHLLGLLDRRLRVRFAAARGARTLSVCGPLAAALPNMLGGGLNGRFRSPVAGTRQIQSLAMLDSNAFFRGRMLCTTSLPGE